MTSRSSVAACALRKQWYLLDTDHRLGFLYCTKSILHPSIPRASKLNNNIRSARIDTKDGTSRNNAARQQVSSLSRAIQRCTSIIQALHLRILGATMRHTSIHRALDLRISLLMMRIYLLRQDLTSAKHQGPCHNIRHQSCHSWGHAENASQISCLATALSLVQRQGHFKVSLP